LFHQGLETAREGLIVFGLFLQTLDNPVNTTTVAIAVVRRHRRHPLSAQTHTQPNRYVTVRLPRD
jgi:hypothetical protein